MEDHTARLADLRSQLTELRYSLESLGGAKRLAQRGRIADVERQIGGLLAPAELAPVAATSA